MSKKKISLLIAAVVIMTSLDTMAVSIYNSNDVKAAESVQDVNAKNADAIAPVLTYDTNGYVEGTYSNKPVKITLGNSAGNTGKIKYLYTIGGDNNLFTADNNEINLTVTGEFTVTVWAESYAGLKSEKHVIKVNIDNYVPELKLTEVIQGDNSHVIHLTSYAGITDVAEITVSKDGGEAVEVKGNNYPITENGHYIFTIVGNNGLSNTKEIDITDLPSADNNNPAPAENPSQDKDNSNSKVSTTKTGDVSTLGLALLSLGSAFGIKLTRKRK